MALNACEYLVMACRGGGAFATATTWLLLCSFLAAEAQVELIESGEALQAAGEHEAALQVLNTVAEMSGRVLHRLALSELELGQTEAAAAHLRQALALQGDEWTAAHMTELAELLVRAVSPRTQLDAPSSPAPPAAATPPPLPPPVPPPPESANESANEPRGVTPPGLVRRFNSAHLPPLPARTSWVGRHRLHAFVAPTVWRTNDFGALDLFVGAGVEVTGSLASVFAYRAQIRGGGTLLDPSASGRLDSRYDSLEVRGERSDLAIDVSVGARVYLGATGPAFVGLGGRAGLHRFTIPGELTVSAESSRPTLRTSRTLVFHQGLIQAVFELGYLLHPLMEMRFELNVGQPTLGASLVVTVPLYAWSRR